MKMKARNLTIYSKRGIAKAMQRGKFTGRTDIEAEALVLWLPYAKSWLTGKDPDAGKDYPHGGKLDRRYMGSPCIVSSDSI